MQHLRATLLHCIINHKHRLLSSAFSQSGDFVLGYAVICVIGYGQLFISSDSPSPVGSRGEAEDKYLLYLLFLDSTQSLFDSSQS